jgi:hypothetical protein
MKHRALCAVLIGAVFPLLAWSTTLDDGVAAISAGRYQDALKILLPIANDGNDEAQRIVGEMCFKGQGMKPNAVAAFKWNEIAAANGNKIAQYNLGYMYEAGQGVPRSVDLAIRSYKLSAAQQYVLAQRRLGDLYAGTDRNQAIYWYDQARRNGDQEARKAYSKLTGERYAEDLAEAEVQRDQERRDQDALDRKETAKTEARIAAAQAENRSGAAEIIMGQVRQNAAEARAMIRTVNRETATANAQIARASEQKRTQDRSQDDRRTASSTSSRTTSASRSGTSSAEATSTSNSSVPTLAAVSTSSTASTAPQGTTSSGTYVDTKEVYWQRDANGPKKTVKKWDVKSPWSSEAEARRSAEEHFAVVKRNLESNFTKHVFYERLVSVEGINCSPNLVGPNGKVIQWGCNMGYVVEVPNSPSGGGTLSK